VEKETRENEELQQRYSQDLENFEKESSSG